jgi:cardiolipin synthase A/B
MTTVFVTFPVLRGSNRFFIQYGRRWSVVEHLLLYAAAEDPASAAELAEKSGLPRRVILEAFIRLMRAGWVEMATENGVIVFRATPLGAVHALNEQLPAATVEQLRWRSYHIEQITGGVFRKRELETRSIDHLPASSDSQIVTHLEGSFLPGQENLNDVFVAIEGEDEEIAGVERSGTKLTERHAVVSVRDGVIEGLPARASLALREIILDAAKKALASKAGKGSTSVQRAQAPAEPKASQAEAPASRLALYDPEDLIVDGEAHRKAIDRLIRTARERLIIHSTFVNDNGDELLPALLHAAGNGVRIDLLWGQADDGAPTNPSQKAAERLAGAITAAGRKDSVKIHPYSTYSHAKIAVADNGKGGWYALVGSCNWLGSDFSSFETSLRLRDPRLVGELIRSLASLSKGRPGIWSDFATSVTVLGRRVERITKEKGRTANIRLVLAPDHANLTLEARDRAKRRIFVLSHRLGIAARPVSLLPMLSAVSANKIDARAFYGRTTGPLSGMAGADLIREFAKEGVTIRPVHRPRLHAKVLGWDDDALAISSLNWLSADPSQRAPFSEIGVLVEAPKIAENFFRVFDTTRID